MDCADGIATAAVDWKQRRLEHKPWRDLILREPCVYCGRARHEIQQSKGKPVMTIDHIVPRHLTGGRRRHHWDNEAPACWNCNHARAATPFIVFMAQRAEKQRELQVRWGNMKARLRRTGQWRHGMRARDFGIAF